MGFWLFLSSFLWFHGPYQTLNAWVVSILAVTFALAGLEARPNARYANWVLGGWLVVSSFMLPETRPATAVNHVLVGVILAVMASLPRLGREPRTQP
ncbi:MAG TPA: hypothetical protein VHL80_13925 [Polyangia bacterium]|nr:hypothetical protein [Polyangia bacterium]